MECADWFAEWKVYGKDPSAILLTVLCISTICLSRISIFLMSSGGHGYPCIIHSRSPSRWVILCTIICASRSQMYFDCAILFVKDNPCACGWTTLSSCLPMADLVLISTRTVQWSPTPLWKDNCRVDVTSRSKVWKTVPIGSLPPT